MNGNQSVSAQAIEPEQAIPNAVNGIVSNPPRFSTVSALQLRDMKFPEREWIIDGVIPKGLMSAIVAQSGTGKTWLMLDMARTLATGGLWANQIQVDQRVVGLMDLEGNYTGLQERWLALEQGQGALNDDAAERIHFLSDIGGINVLDAAMSSTIKATITHNRIDVLFVDTLSRTHQLDENSADMRRVMFSLERISRDTDCTIIIAHHTGKNNERGGRGSSSIKDALQHEITLTGNLQSGVTLALTKAKSAALNPKLTQMRLEQSAQGKRLAFSSESGITTGRPSKDHKIEAFLSEHLTAPRRRIDVMNALVKNGVCSKGKASQTIKDLIADGQLIEDSAGHILWASSSETLFEPLESVYEQ